MGSVDAEFAWAVPVKVEQLGAHLEAYVNLQPTLTTLRLCNRFGYGEKVFITRLPVELVKNIEDCLMSEEREKTRKEWAADLRCFEHRCEPKDHLSPDDWEVAREEIRDRDPYFNKDWYGKERTEDERVNAYMRDVEWEYDHEHYGKRSEWQARVGVEASQDRDRDRGVLGHYAPLVHAHFRLQTWTAHVRIAKSDDCWADGDFDAAETTVAYLKMPTTHSFRDQWRIGSYEYESGGMMECGYGIPVNAPAPPTKKEQASFKRAMKVLGLEPYTHSSPAAARQSVESTGGNKMRTSWEPQLTMLFKTAAYGI